MDTKDHHLVWKTLERKWLEDYHIFNIYQVRREAADGKIGTFYEVDAPHWVTIIPHFTDPVMGECFLMVRQYRHGTDSVTLEFPAGMVNEGENPEIGARRELLEETGYIPGKLMKIGEVSPNPAFMNNLVTTYLAEDLQLVKGQELDELEMIDIIPVPVKKVIASMGEGEYNNGIMMISLTFYLRKMGMITARESR